MIAKKTVKKTDKKIEKKKVKRKDKKKNKRMPPMTDHSGMKMQASYRGMSGIKGMMSMANAYSEGPKLTTSSKAKSHAKMGHKRGK